MKTKKHTVAGLLKGVLPVIFILLPLTAWAEEEETSGTQVVSGQIVSGQVVRGEEVLLAELSGVPEEAQQLEQQAIEILSSMSAEEKAAQLFFITPEALTGVDAVTAAGPQTTECYAQYPVGGIVYFSANITSREQTAEMLTNMQQISMERIGLPVFLAVDEEGGTVTRVSRRGIEGVPDIGDMFEIGQTGDPQQAYQVGTQIGTYLSELGFNVDFAPVADIYTNEANTVIGKRAFGTDAETVSPMVSMAVSGLQESGVSASLKHFPGHGDTAQDSHTGSAVTYKTLEELCACEFLPFCAGIEAGADFVMAGHISLPNVLEDSTPASLSEMMLTEILRKELGFDGIIITDAMNMGAIANTYASGEAAVKAILAGADMILMPADFHSAYEEVCAAIADGRISQERLDEAAGRIIRKKLQIQTL